ncbi:M20/M25/M40 family metallo-hydrolase [Acuticoccus sp. I52.16.1]|uniref:M20/M25/M40 family metallo-hydrolase n=1 Tax=Acuticoccus sp. I52.16.1 TaxID=2928472 RepID=UPI001FD448B7|nr:M20/M25/M40 family metallo-hydrolase [Acuticoccus sp. I52.16.1]UOM36850.1 M20/M25/M40 family metallo-hydrolase [Acuticoccus sp. I52.16.1]
MDVNTLPLSSDAMLEGLRPWIECESPTYDPAAVTRMVGIACDRLRELGARVEHIPGPPGLGDCARAVFPHPRPDTPGVLVMAHLDTVHPHGTLERLPFRREGDIATGPGLCDMKGGTYAALEAARALAEVGHETPLPIHVLLTSDEEIGTPGTRALIEAEAAKHKYVLVPEPGLMGPSAVCTGRYAIARYHLAAHGVASHAGIRLSKGRSAIREMAERIPQIEAMTDADCTYSVGVVHGGQWVNCVSTVCRGEALSMAKRQADLDRGIERMLGMSHRNEDGSGFEVALSVVRPVWEPGAGTLALFERAKRIAATMGIELTHDSAGGGSDANFTGALGMATLDGLGLDGEMVHTLHEYIEVESLARRARLMAGLMAELD